MRLAVLQRERPDDCWLWDGTLLNGYGITRAAVPRRGRIVNMLVHRLAYELLVGPIPDGLEIDHLCRTPRCFNPKHMEPVTRTENNRRSNSWSGANARKTHCANGHALSGENVRESFRRGYRERVCRTCMREAQRACKQRKKDRAAH